MSLHSACTLLSYHAAAQRPRVAGKRTPRLRDQTNDPVGWDCRPASNHPGATFPVPTSERERVEFTFGSIACPNSIGSVLLTAPPHRPLRTVASAQMPKVTTTSQRAGHAPARTP